MNSKLCDLLKISFQETSGTEVLKFITGQTVNTQMESNTVNLLFYLNQYHGETVFDNTKSLCSPGYVF